MKNLLNSVFNFFRNADTDTWDEGWCFIPEGNVTIEGIRGSYIPANETTTVTVSPFLMAKYPITNAQYAQFLRDGGYSKRKFWQRESWDYKQSQGWNHPAYWGDEHFNQPDQPVVGISWYEALAFTTWLPTSNDPLTHYPSELKITLPTEAHWQRAATGDHQTLYPYGNQFDATRSTTRESNIEYPTPVNAYPAGASPYGVVDMSGNVLEWTLTDWRSGSTQLDLADASRILRGGSFANTYQLAATTARSYSNVFFRRNIFGLRVCAVAKE